MKKVKYLALVACLAVFASHSNSAQAGIVNNLVAGLNTFEDQSRESVFDINGDGMLSVGDVIAGFGRFDDRNPALTGGLPGSGPGSAYAAFSTQVLTITDDMGGAWTLGEAARVTFGAVTSAAALAAGLDLQTLTGDGNVAATDIAAIYDNVPTNLIDSTGGATDILGMIAIVGGATTELTLDFGGTGTGADHWIFIADATAAATAIGNLGNLSLATLSGGLPGLSGFHAALSVNFGGSNLLPLVTDNTDGFPGTQHQFVISNGAISGASDLYGGSAGAPSSIQFGTISDGMGGTINMYGLSNNVDASVFATVPEPASIVTWGILAGIAALVGVRRRKRSLLGNAS